MSRPNTLACELRKRPWSFLMGVTIVTPNTAWMNSKEADTQLNTQTPEGLSHTGKIDSETHIYIRSTYGVKVVTTFLGMVGHVNGVATYAGRNALLLTATHYCHLSTYINIVLSQDC